MLPDKVLCDVHSDDEIKEDEMGGACGTYEVVKYMQGFSCETQKERDQFAKPWCRWKLILK